MAVAPNKLGEAPSLVTLVSLMVPDSRLVTDPRVRSKAGEAPETIG